MGWHFTEIHTWHNCIKTKTVFSTLSMIQRSRRMQWTDTGQRVCLQHKSWRKLRGGQRGHFQRQIMTTYLLKRHQRRKESITLPRQESRGLEIVIIFCLLHTGRNTPSKSQGLTLPFHVGSGEGWEGGWATRYRSVCQSWE